jgi:hypothetical protein
MICAAALRSRQSSIADSVQIFWLADDHRGAYAIRNIDVHVRPLAHAMHQHGDF